MKECDKQKLVMPMMALYAQVYLHRDEPRFQPVYEAFSRDIERTFPKTFEFVCEDGRKEKRGLFAARDEDLGRWGGGSRVAAARRSHWKGETNA